MEALEIWKLFPWQQHFLRPKIYRLDTEALSWWWSESVAKQGLLHVTSRVQTPSGSEVTQCPQHPVTGHFTLAKWRRKSGNEYHMNSGPSVVPCCQNILSSFALSGPCSAPPGSFFMIQEHGAHFISSHTLWDFSAPGLCQECTPILSWKQSTHKQHWKVGWDLTSSKRSFPIRFLFPGLLNHVLPPLSFHIIPKHFCIHLTQ